LNSISKEIDKITVKAETKLQNFFFGNRKYKNKVINTAVARKEERENEKIKLYTIKNRFPTSKILIIFFFSIPIRIKFEEIEKNNNMPNILELAKIELILTTPSLKIT
jgi:hypothetical protein